MADPYAQFNDFDPYAQFQDYAQKEQGFLGRVGAALQRRADRGAINRQLEQEGKQSGFERQLKDVASLGGFLTGDLPAEVLTSAWKALPETVTKPVGEFASNAATSIANTVPLGGAYPIKDVAAAYQAQFNQLEQTDPLTASRLRAAGDIGNIALASMPIKGQSAISATAKVAGKAADVTQDVAGSVGRAVGSVVAPKLDPGLAEIGALAKKHGVPVSLDQLTFSKPVKAAQKVSQEIPFSGIQSFREKQLLKWQEGLFNTVGVKADRFTQKNMNTAFQKVGGEFDALTKGKTFTLGDDFAASLASTKDEIQSQLGNDAASVFEKEALKVIDDFGTGGQVKGEILAKQRSRINRLARGAKPEHQEALFDLENILVDSITGGDPKAQAMLSEAKRKYKNLIALEPLAVKAKGGFISPSLLNDRVARVYKRAFTRGENVGDIGELAKIGFELLPELGGSDTKSALTLGVLGGSAAANPVLAISALTANRIAQAGLNRNQVLVNKALMKEIGKLPPAEAQKLLEGLK